ncbi:DNA mismatch repair protein MutS [Clostridium bornimense]|uniref:DNA mismatch repair protein MutS n=1 Tax=Clostridium bornimense TaxID=1216932 RepID=UPI001C1279D4|nr:DNA mismatch repair protein MutS [Clostridium bornimense]MBU5316828.1 DNA mismatch repair protein MutS [Clostridium bornimense]
MALTPMMKQYVEIKETCKDCIIFYRLGDFYEMFFEDAEIAARELELVLTGRDCGLEKRAPMCGVPFHASSMYIGRLVSRGYKVAIVEQLEDPSKAKGLVKRGVVKIYTPGTYADTAFLEESKNNYILTLGVSNNNCTLVFADVSTGEFNVTSFEYDESILISEVSKYAPKELLVLDSFDDKIINIIKERVELTLTKRTTDIFNIDEEKLIKHFGQSALERVNDTSKLIICGALNYIIETQKESLNHINKINFYSVDNYLSIDINSRRNLELTETLKDKAKKGSLLWVLDKTSTAMGARQLRKWIERPLINKISINRRLYAVEELYNNLAVREDLREALKDIYDIERLVGKISSKNVNAKELISLKNSLGKIPEIKNLLKDINSELLKDLYSNLDELKDVFDLLEKSISNSPAITLKEGNIIKAGYNEEIDTLREAKENGRIWIANLESKEKEETGIKSLKVSYNKVFGYYIEVTKTNLQLVPTDRYIRKQTLANAERYITEELKVMEEKILGAEEKLISLEYDTFVDIREKVEAEIERMQKSALVLSTLDVLASLATVALENNYVKPTVTDEYKIDIVDGRHPVIEKLLSNGQFVSNNTILDESQSFMLITGPNMGGKSTYMRQIALISVMAQMGSFIPATSGEIGICDKIFTRIGASDDLASGKSTFMVEMWEVANILNNVTEKSLVLLDEVGRGTSTYDGLSIAWAVIEHLTKNKNVKCKTLFATHYHELTQLEQSLDGFKNYYVGVKKIDDELIFMHKILEGKEDQSYGIEVAKLAGLPKSVVDRSREILESIEGNKSVNTKEIEVAVTEDENEISEVPKIQETKEESYSNGTNSITQISFESLEKDNLIKTLKELDIISMTPMDSMNMLYKLVNEAKNL